MPGPSAEPNTPSDAIKALIDPIFFVPYISGQNALNTVALQPWEIPINKKAKAAETKLSASEKSRRLIANGIW